MLAFLRRHQKILFAFITVVIVISFSFFGTYSVFVSNPVRDGVAFTAIDGSAVYQSELHDVIALISTDATDVRTSMQPYTGNGLNDGVLAKDIFQSGLAEVIIKPFKPELASEFATRLEREKRYVPYRHPTAPFISAELVWNYFAPQIKKNYDILMAASQPLSDEAFNARVHLYLAERDFPAPYLKQLIRYQESQHQTAAPDEQLISRDLSLFGYHQVQDWFGKDFIELTAKYIINVAKYAQMQGIKISTDEALGSLFKNADEIVKDSRLSQYYGPLNPNEYFQTLVHRLGMDQGRAAYAWRWVLLFRRYMNEITDSVLLDGSAFGDFYNHQNEFVDIELFSLPKELQLRNIEDVEKLDLYCKAVSQIANSSAVKPGALWPLEVQKSPSEVKKLYPDLVRRSFHLRYSMVDKQEIESKIGLKKTWQWQVADANWIILQEKFPELIKVKADTEDLRHAALDALDAPTRIRIDAFSRTCIVDQHPEWIEEALASAEPKDVEVQLRDRGGRFPFPGIQDRTAFFALLDQAPLNTASKQLSSYTQDHIRYYSIIVLERGPETVLSYEEALDDSTLDQMLTQVLDLTYQRARKDKPTQYLEQSGEWKPLAAVRAEIADIYFEETFASLDKEVARLQKEMPHLTSWDDQKRARIACFLADPMKKAYLAVQANPDAFSDWKLMKSEKRMMRSNVKPEVDLLEAFSLQKHGFSRLSYSPMLGLVFYRVIDKGFSNSQQEIRQKVLAAKDHLSRKAYLELGQKLLDRMMQDHALTVDNSKEAS